MVDKNQRYLGSFHQRLKRAPIIKTTKSPSIEAAMRRLIVAIGEIVPQGLNSCLVAQWRAISRSTSVYTTAFIVTCAASPDL